MALRASQGHPLLVFAGQTYGGALISWIEGGLIYLFGLHMSLFWVVYTVLALGGAVVRRVGARRFIQPVAAAAAGGLFFVFSPVWIGLYSQAIMFYLAAIVISLVVAWLVLCCIDPRAWWLAMAFGFTGGVAIWCTPMTVCVLVPRRNATSAGLAPRSRARRSGVATGQRPRGLRLRGGRRCVGPHAAELSVHL